MAQCFDRRHGVRGVAQTRTHGDLGFIQIHQPFETKRPSVPALRNRFLEKSVQIVEEFELAVLVSDAGTPAISDPGFLLVRACLQKNISIECLPGPSALIPAIVGSGFPCDKFIFEGFLPHKKGRQTRLKELSSEDRTIIFYESPHRLLKTLEQMLPFFSESRQICVVRELSKMFETYHRGTLSEQIAYFKETAPRGEIVLLVHGVD